MKWEYHFFVVATGQPEVEASLNKLGNEGWELVTSYVNPSGATYFVFKRPLNGNILDDPDVLKNPSVLKR